MVKYYITLLVLLVTNVLAETTLYPTAFNETSICFDCPVEGNHCFLFNNNEKQECLKESNGGTIMNSCTSQDEFFDYKDNEYSAKIKFQSGECRIDLKVTIDGLSTSKPVCEMKDNINACVYFFPEHEVSTSKNHTISSTSNISRANNTMANSSTTAPFSSSTFPLPSSTIAASSSSSAASINNFAPSSSNVITSSAGSLNISIPCMFLVLLSVLSAFI